MFLISWLLPLGLLTPLMIVLTLNIESKDYISAYFIGLILATYFTKLDRFLEMKDFSFKAILRKLSPFDEGRSLWESYFAVMIASAIMLLIISYAFKVLFVTEILIAYAAYGVILFAFAKVIVKGSDDAKKSSTAPAKAKKAIKPKVTKEKTKES